MIKKSLLALTMGAAVFAGAVQAQTPGPMMGEGHQKHAQGQDRAHKPGERDAQRHQHRMDKLKQSLKLSQDQGQAWAAFEGAMQPGTMTRPDHEAMSKMTTPERLEVMTQMKTQHSAQMQKRLDATRAFYAALTPEQQKTFDQETAQMMRGANHQGHHGERHGH